jgi:Starch binding domain
VAVGEEVAVVGNMPELGSWDVAKGIQLTWTPGHKWRGRVEVSAAAKLAFKVVKVGTDGVTCEWERGEDRLLDVHAFDAPYVTVDALWGSAAAVTESEVDPQVRR